MSFCLKNEIKQNKNRDNSCLWDKVTKGRVRASFLDLEMARIMNIDGCAYMHTYTLTYGNVYQLIHLNECTL